MLDVFIEKLNGNLIYTSIKDDNNYTYSSLLYVNIIAEDGGYIAKELIHNKLEDRLKEITGQQEIKIHKEYDLDFTKISNQQNQQATETKEYMFPNQWRINLLLFLDAIKNVGVTEEELYGEKIEVYWDMLVTETNTSTIKVPYTRKNKENQNLGVIWDYFYLIAPSNGFMGGINYGKDALNLLKKHNIMPPAENQVTPLPDEYYFIKMYNNEWKEFNEISLLTKTIINIIRFKYNTDDIIDPFFNVFQNSRMAKTNKTDVLEVRYSSSEKEITFPMYLKELLGEEATDVMKYLAQRDLNEQYEEFSKDTQPTASWTTNEDYHKTDDECQYNDDYMTYMEEDYSYKEIEHKVESLYRTIKNAEKDKIIENNLEPFMLLIDYFGKPLNELLEVYQILEKHREIKRKNLFLYNFAMLLDPMNYTIIMNDIFPSSQYNNYAWKYKCKIGESCRISFNLKKIKYDVNTDSTQHQQTHQHTDPTTQQSTTQQQPAINQQTNTQQPTKHQTTKDTISIDETVGF